MASNEPEYLPIRTGATEAVDDDLVEAPHAPSSDISSATDEPQLMRIMTSRSAREKRETEFQPIAAGDRDELYRIASSFTGAGTAVTRTSTRASGLERRDTLYGVNIGDPVLDPRSSEFDPYKWSRMYVQFPSYQ